MTSSDSPALAARQASRRSAWLRGGASVFVAAAFVWMFRSGGVPLLPSRQSWDQLQWWGVPGHLVLLLTSVYFRTRRWLRLLEPLSSERIGRRDAGICLVGYAATFIAPFRLGEFVRPYLIAKSGRVGFIQAIATVMAERIVDGLTVSCVAVAATFVAIPQSPLPTGVGSIELPVSAAPHALRVALTASLLAVSLMAAFYFWKAEAQRWTQLVLSRLSLPLARMASGIIARLAEGFGVLRSRALAGFLLDNASYWSLCFLAQWILLRSVGLPATIAEACVIVGIMAYGSLLPAGPGVFGAFHLSAYVGLALYYPSASVLSTGAVFVLVSYLGHLVTHLLGGLMGLWLMAPSPKP